MIDLSKIPYTELKRQYVSFYLIERLLLFDSLLFQNDDLKYIHESINYSVPIEKVKQEITFKYDLADWQFQIYNAHNNVKCACVVPNIDDNVDKVIQDMSVLKYSLAKSVNKTIQDMEYVVMYFEPYYSLDLTNEVKSHNIIFHISPEYIYNDIKQNGFIPIHKNTVYKHPDRLYCYKGNITDDDIDGGLYMLWSTNKNPKNKGIYLVYTISLRNLRDITFYADPYTPNGIYTYDKIPYKCVTNIQKFKVSHNGIYEYVTKNINEMYNIKQLRKRL